MIKLKLSKRLQSMSAGDKIAFEFPFFMLYLRAITSGTISRILLLEVAAEKIIFKYMEPYLVKIINLMTHWRYPQAKATEIISEEAPTEDFKKFLFKFSQSIASGEPVNMFIEREHKNYMAEWVSKRLQAVNRLKTLSDGYLPLMSVTLFMTTTLLISSIFYDAKLMIMLSIATVVVISFLLYFISWMIFQAARPDSILIDDQKEKPSARKRAETVAIVCIVLAVTTLFIPLEDNFQHFVIMGVVLLSGGAVGKYYISKVKERESVYPSFFRFMCSNLGAGITLRDVLKSAVETDFGILNPAIMSLNNMIQMRVEPRVAWWSFETELDSKFIRRINLIMTDTIYTGGDIAVAYKFIDEFYHEYNTIRNRRYTAVNYHAGILVPLYVVSTALFGVIDGFFNSLVGFIAKMATMIDFFQIPDVTFMRLFFMFSMALFALNNVFSLYNIEGDSRFTVLFFLGLQMTFGGALYMIISDTVAGWLLGVAIL